MLEELSIENLGVIESARVAFGPGLTVISGETGAGKTMVLTGLGLLMGAKADPGTVRPGAASAVVEGRLAVGDRESVRTRVADAAGELDEDGSLVVVRTLAAEGRSRAYLGGRSAPQAVLADIAGDLVTVHGQADQMRLRTAAHQRGALDAYAGAGLAGVLAKYRTTWAARGALVREIDDITTHAVARAQEAETLRRGLAEIERVDPQPGEDEQVAATIARLTHAEELRLAAHEAHVALHGDEADDAPGALATVERARRALDAARTTDPETGRLADRLTDVGYQLADIAQDIAGYADTLVADPAGLEAANQRRADLGGLRPYGPSIDEVLAWSAQAGLRLLDLDDGGDRLESMKARLADLDEQVVALAGQVSQLRREAGEALGAAVTGELAGLAMAGAHLVVEVTPADAPGPHGADVVTFLLIAHPGAKAAPLGKGASGGELSRVMLALEVALAGASDDAPTPTFIFDEVDAGVGGRAAVEVGRRLASLARTTQVLVVTHLAQVAAFADHHLVVTKVQGAANATVTQVEEVRDERRVRELARMLSGQDDSVTARQHALELIEASTVGR